MCAAMDGMEGFGVVGVLTARWLPGRCMTRRGTLLTYSGKGQVE